MALVGLNFGSFASIFLWLRKLRLASEVIFSGVCPLRF